MADFTECPDCGQLVPVWFMVQPKDYLPSGCATILKNSSLDYQGSRSQLAICEACAGLSSALNDPEATLLSQGPCPAYYPQEGEDEETFRRVREQLTERNRVLKVLDHYRKDAEYTPAYILRLVFNAIKSWNPELESVWVYVGREAEGCFVQWCSKKIPTLGDCELGIALTSPDAIQRSQAVQYVVDVCLAWFCDTCGWYYNGVRYSVRFPEVQDITEQLFGRQEAICVARRGSY